MDAAARVFAERGLDATLNEIAKVAESVLGTVYRKFADKEAMLDALFDEKTTRWSMLLSRPRSSPTPELRSGNCCSA